MATLTDAVKALAGIVRGVSGVRMAPNYPPDQASVFPFAVVMARAGTFAPGVAGESKALHDIVVQLHVARKDLPVDVQAAMGFSDSVPLAIMDEPTWSGTISMYQRISYEFGEMEYGGVQTVGWRWVVEGVKIRSNL